MGKLKQAHGNWVTGERFWDRKEDIALFTERVREGAHLLLVAQRRMGKTSLMKEVAKRLADEFECVFVDFQDGSSPQDAIAALSLALHPHKSLWNHTRELFGNILDKIEKVGPSELGITIRAGLSDGNW
ncbi:MAG: ATP-binding protein, partial [Lentisphaeria bacterium]|nr:ATP-binding protein [Lentisphaeria bacterium]